MPLEVYKEFCCLFADDKEWDAFVSYKSHHIDEHFVVQVLYPKLEKELGFKLCLHFRDFVPGESNVLYFVYFFYFVV